MPKILTIEDSEFERTVIVRMLNKAGYTDIIEATNGEDGIEKYKAEKPDLVLLDLRMPGMSGEEVLKKLREMDAKVIVIIVSIVRKEETVKQMLEEGAHEYITKPVTEEKLVAAIKKVLG